MTSPHTRAIEPVGPFVIKDIQYQSLKDHVKLAIIWNDYIECVSYELEKPYRIVIDPLEEAYCDYEEKVYFEGRLTYKRMLHSNLKHWYIL